VPGRGDGDVAARAAAAPEEHGALAEAERSGASEASPSPEARRPFPPTAFAAYGWWILILYMFFIMAVVCDDYLVPAVDIICERWSIPEDVAGATLMAFACNGPELLTNVCAIFVTHSSVGMGTIVGSAIFNIMIIVGVCPIVVAGGVMDVPKATFLRDSLFSAISIALLAWALPVFTLFNSSVLFGMAFVYAIVVAKFRTIFGAPDEAELEQLQRSIDERRERSGSLLKPPDRRHSDLTLPGDNFLFDESVLLRRQASGGRDMFGYQRLGTSSSVKRLELVTGRVVPTIQAYNYGPGERRELWKSKSDLAPKFPPGSEELDQPSCLAQALGWVRFALSAPTTYALLFTIPDVRKEVSGGGRYVTAFFMSMLWLSSTAFVVCLGSDSINYYWGIPQSFLGLTLAAAGTSWPNLLASAITAKCGRGPIAVSNALGSNVQNVFLVLAGPIWVKVLIDGEYVMGGDDIWSSVAWMALTLGVCVVCVVLRGWKLTTGTGWFFFFVYTAYVTQTTLSSAD